MVILAMAAGVGLAPSGAGEPEVGPTAPGDLRPPAVPLPPQRAYIGTVLTTNSVGWGEVLHGGQASGVLVLMVLPASPAQEAGLSAGDVIVAVDGEAMHDDEQLGVVLRASSSDAHLFTVLDRSGAAKSVTVRAGDKPPGSLPDLIQQLVTVDPTPNHRFVYARTSADSKTALAVLDDLIAEFPALAGAHAAKAERLLDVVGSDPSGDRVRLPIESATRAVQIDPAALSSQLTAARVFLRAGDLAAAGLHAEAALAVDDHSAAAHHLLGRARLLMGEPAAALPELHRAAVLDPYVEDHHRYLSECYSALGDSTAARQADDALKALQRFNGQPQSVSADGTPGAVGLACALATLLGVGVARSTRRTHGREGPRRPRTAPRLRPPVIAVLETIAVVALFSVVVPSLGRLLSLSTQASGVTEIVDHVAPGVVALIVSGWAMRLELTESSSEDSLLLVAAVVGTAGLWITSTHLPLVRQALRGAASPEVALFHSVAGPAMIGMAALLMRSSTRRSRSLAAEPGARSAQQAHRGVSS